MQLQLNMINTMESDLVKLKWWFRKVQQYLRMSGKEI